MLLEQLWQVTTMFQMHSHLFDIVDVLAEFALCSVVSACLATFLVLLKDFNILKLLCESACLMDFLKAVFLLLDIFLTISVIEGHT